jgi:drug/metabolite transporter (DMT)-like permease
MMIIGENISIMRWTGIFVIFSGVVIIGFSK